MCGRYSVDLKWDDVARLYDLAMERPRPARPVRTDRRGPAEHHRVGRCRAAGRACDDPGRGRTPAVIEDNPTLGRFPVPVR